MGRVPQAVEQATERAPDSVAVLNFVQCEKAVAGQRLTVERFDLDRNDHRASAESVSISAFSFGSGHGSNLTRLPASGLYREIGPRGDLLVTWKVH